LELDAPVRHRRKEAAGDLTTDERAELVRLRREGRVKDVEIEVLMRASAFFGRENILQHDQPVGPLLNGDRLDAAVA
jgi:transposase-like protein